MEDFKSSEGEPQKSDDDRKRTFNPQGCAFIFRLRRRCSSIVVATGRCRRPAMQSRLRRKPSIAA
jgi:hypothetical protein